MKKPPAEFKRYRTTVLRLLWRQWNALGAAGQDSLAARSLVDPEALLLISLSLGRFDARLFDEVVDWLFLNGGFINVQRLSLIQKTMSFESGPQLSALAAHLCSDSEQRPKWQKLSITYSAAAVQPLFFTIDGKPLPVGNKKDQVFIAHGLLRPPLSSRGLSQAFPPEKSPAFLLRLRALMGISLRCEMICLLAGGDAIHPAEAARRITCNRRSAQNVLREMALSGVVESIEGDRKINYRLHGHILSSLVPLGLKWTNWTAFYRGLEILWRGGDNLPQDSLTLSAHLRRCAGEAQRFFNEAKTGVVLTDPGRTPSLDYIPVFFNNLEKITAGFEKLV